MLLSCTMISCISVLYDSCDDLLCFILHNEGEGLGSSRSGIADPISAGNVKIDNLGVGATKPGEVKPDDDIYEQYKKRMMLGYRYRPNPMVYIFYLQFIIICIYFCTLPV